MKNINENAREKVTIYLSKSLIALCDKGKNLKQAPTRTAFIEEAIKMYTTWLDGKNYTRFISPAYQSIVEGIVNNASRKISNNIFKLSVEVSMLMHAIAYAYSMEDADLEAMRIECINEVKELSGTLNFEEIVDIANGD